MKLHILSKSTFIFVCCMLTILNCSKPKEIIVAETSHVENDLLSVPGSVPTIIDGTQFMPN